MFQDRKQAGEILAGKLKKYKGTKNLVVLAIPRGGVVVGQKITRALKAPLNVLVTKKIGAPQNPELAIGAVGPASWRGKPVVNEKLAAKVGATKDYLQSEIARLKKEIKQPPLDLKDKTVILTDDGVATGATMEAAIQIVRQQNPAKIVVAVPVTAKDALARLEALADEVVYLEAPALFFAVGQFYQNFDQVSDQEVVQLLKAK